MIHMPVRLGLANPLQPEAVAPNIFVQSRFQKPIRYRKIAARHMIDYPRMGRMGHMDGMLVS